MKKITSLLLAAMLLFGLAACGGADTGSATTVAPPVSITGDGSQPASAPPAEEALDRSFLTGLEKGDGYPIDRRITAIMVNNISSSRPTRGLTEAAIVVESQVEGGITRFMAIYEDYEAIPMVGPVRSARDQFFQLILPYWAFYIHDGHSTPMYNYFNDWEYEEFNLDTGRYGANTTDSEDVDSLAWRDQDRLSKGYDRAYTEYTRGDHIKATIKNNNLNDFRSYSSSIFDFVPYTEPARVPTGGEAAEVAVIHSGSYRSYFEYDAAAGRYMMSQFNGTNGDVEKTIDENNDQQLGFDNLIVLFAPMAVYAGTEQEGGLKKFDFHGGVGYYFSQGSYELVYWKKGGPNEPMLMYTSQEMTDETMVKVNPGTTYMGLVDDKELESFHTTLVSGTAGDAVASGDVNPDEVDPEADT